MQNVILRQLRGERTLQEVANGMGLPKSTYAFIEAGRRRGKPETVQKIAKFYGISLDQIYFIKSI